VTGNFSFACQGGQAINEAKQLHPQARVTHSPVDYFIIPAHSIAHLGNKRAILSGGSQEKFGDFLGFGFVGILGYLYNHSGADSYWGQGFGKEPSILDLSGSGQQPSP